MLDFFVGYDKEVVIGPEETSVEVRGHCYFDVDEQVAVVAVPDSNGSVMSDAISSRRVLPFRLIHLSRVTRAFDEHRVTRHRP